jgi:hypothetical protein
MSPDILYTPARAQRLANRNVREFSITYEPSGALGHPFLNFQGPRIESVLRLRQDEPEAFLNYRSTLTSIVKTYISDRKSVGDAEARDIYTDLLKPQIRWLLSRALVLFIAYQCTRDGPTSLCNQARFLREGPMQQPTRICR